jgi:hypothetical protein
VVSGGWIISHGDEEKMEERFVFDTGNLNDKSSKSIRGLQQNT